MSDRPVVLLIEDIWEAMGKVSRFTKGMSADRFARDQKTTDAVVRNLEIIGEAASRLPASFKGEHAKIEWAKIVGLRHRIVHAYFSVDLQIVWHMIQMDVPLVSRKNAKGCPLCFHTCSHRPGHILGQVPA